MSRWQPEPVGLGVTARQWALAWREPGSQASTWKTWSVGTASAKAELEGLHLGPMRITIADDLMRHWVIEAPEGTASLHELRRYAALRFENLFGESASDWEIEGDWHPSGPVVCQAMPKALAEQLRDWATQAKQPIVDTMACGARLKLRSEGHNKHDPASTRPSVWVSVGTTQCTLWWQHPPGRTHRIATLRAEPGNPWARVAQEIQRVNAAQADDGQRVADVHWASLLACAEPVDDGKLRFTCQASSTATQFPSDTAAAVLLASGGCR